VIRATSRCYALPRTRSTGFTLMEVMIVVVIVGILMAVSIPAYESSLQKGRRADAKAALLDVANRQEQLMLDRGTYTLTMTDLGFGNDPMVSPDEFYTVDAAACASGTIARCFVLTATPASGSPQTEDTRCTTLILDWRGAKTATGTDQDNCW